MIDPLFWLGCSLLLLALSLIALLIAAIPALQELARAARSAEKLFDTLQKEFPPTLDAIRRTGDELAELTDDVNEGLDRASQVIQQVDQGLSQATKQAQKLNIGARSAVTGLKTAWKTFTTKKSTSESFSTGVGTGFEVFEESYLDFDEESSNSSPTKRQ